MRFTASALGASDKHNTIPDAWARPRVLEVDAFVPLDSESAWCVSLSARRVQKLGLVLLRVSCLHISWP